MSVTAYGAICAPAAAVRHKCTELLHMADDAAVTLRNEYAIQLLKLPKKVCSAMSYTRTMGVSMPCLVTRYISDLDCLIARDAREPHTCRCAACRWCSSSSSTPAT